MAEDTKQPYYGTACGMREMTETELLEEKRRKMINDLQELETVIQWVKNSGSDDILRRIKAVM